MKHFYNLADLSVEAVESLLDDAGQFKKQPLGKDLDGRQFGLLFLAPSLRTRCSFEVGIRQLSGGVSTLEPSMFYGLELGDGVRMDGDTAEHIKEAVPVLSGFYSGLGLRVMAAGKSVEEDLGDRMFEAFRSHAKVPVFNMESALYHPCQALADMLTIHELLGSHKGRRLTLTWAPHPRPLPTAVPNSLLLAAAQLGMDVSLCHPEGYDLPESITTKAAELSQAGGGRIRISHDQKAAFKDAEIVYAKSWGALSRYDSAEVEQELRQSHSNWTVDGSLMSRSANAFFMHCLPVRRNVVVTDEVIDHPRSAVVQQAENRLHAQKAVLKSLYATG
jgi:N-acetylornithine carbamoyltransferase